MLVAVDDTRVFFKIMIGVPSKLYCIVNKGATVKGPTKQEVTLNNKIL
jgi:hypothetical protein